MNHRVDKSILFKRDGRAPVPFNTYVSYIMSSNRARDTGPELVIRRELSSLGIRGYRLHSRNVPGRPDVVFGPSKVAVFVHGCFWHRCPHCAKPLPKSNTTFWKEKFERNRERDIRKEAELKKAGWKVLTIWECEIRKSPQRAAKRVGRALTHRAASKASVRVSR